MAKSDRPHTAFVTDRGLFQYVVMSFGLKNAGATYQHLVNKLFEGMIGKSFEVYIDDTLVKGTSFEEHLQNLSLVFTKLHGSGLKLNLAKCTFRTRSRRFLGYLLTERGIEVNPKKI